MGCGKLINPRAIPIAQKRLLETNYEGLGKSDAEEFSRDFNEILNLAIKALEQEPKSEWEHDHENKQG